MDLAGCIPMKMFVVNSEKILKLELKVDKLSYLQAPFVMFLYQLNFSVFCFKM